MQAIKYKNKYYTYCTFNRIDVIGIRRRGVLLWTLPITDGFQNFNLVGIPVYSFALTKYTE